MPSIRATSLGFAALLSWTQADTVRASEPLALEVTGDGVAVARAVLILPGSSDLARDLLSDPSNWPVLFASPLRVRSVTRHPDRTITDMYLSPGLAFQELHLIVETREISRLRLETRLIDGDLRRYAHVWHLTSLPGERCTRAALELTMQPRTWMPNWLLRWLMREELTGHTERVVAEAGLRAGETGACVPEPPRRPSD